MEVVKAERERAEHGRGRKMAGAQAALLAYRRKPEERATMRRRRTHDSELLRRKTPFAAHHAHKADKFGNPCANAVTRLHCSYEAARQRRC